MNSDADALKVGDRVRVLLDARTWQTAGWVEGALVRIDPYSSHRSFHWVELDVDAHLVGGGRTRLVSILNPRHIRKA